MTGDRHGTTSATRRKSPRSSATAKTKTPRVDVAYIDAILKAYVLLDRDEARALYAMTKDAALPLEGYAVTVRAIRKLGAAE